MKNKDETRQWTGGCNYCDRPCRGYICESCQANLDAQLPNGGECEPGFHDYEDEYL